MARQQATRMARQGMDVKSFDVAKFSEEHKTLAEKRVKGILILDVDRGQGKGRSERRRKYLRRIAAMARCSEPDRGRDQEILRFASTADWKTCGPR